MSKPKNTYPNQKAHSHRKNGKKQPENRFFMLFMATLGPFGHHQMDLKMYTKAYKWADA
jgi:hypothetical protein